MHWSRKTHHGSTFFILWKGVSFCLVLALTQCIHFALWLPASSQAMLQDGTIILSSHLASLALMNSLSLLFIQQVWQCLLLLDIWVAQTRSIQHSLTEDYKNLAKDLAPVLFKWWRLMIWGSSRNQTILIRFMERTKRKKERKKNEKKEGSWGDELLAWNKDKRLGLEGTLKII